MIIEGKLGTYTVLWRKANVYSELVVFNGKSHKAKFLGIFNVPKKHVWVTNGRKFRLTQDVEKMTPEQMTNWFWEAVIEYEQHVLAWNTQHLLASA